MQRGVQIFFLVIVAAMAGVTMVRYSPGSAAQITAGNDPNLRAAYATAVEVAEGKRVAEASCFRCHGVNGISTTKGVPHLAGQRPAYLYMELQAYQKGARGSHAMENAIKFLSDNALVTVAAYYASLDPAQSTAKSGAGAAPAKPDPVAAGKSAAAGCAACHGESGISKTSGMPSLVGMDPKYLVAAMTAYKSGQRKNELMKSLLSAYTDADLNNIALYYALQQPARAQTAAGGKNAADKAAACAGCHGERGVSTNPAIPSLAGQNAAYFENALRAYKDGSRGEETMKSVAATLDNGTIKELAAYYAAQQAQRPNVRKPLTTAQWAQRCDRCHGVNGNSTDPRTPALAAQRVEYLETVLRAYQTGERKSSAMAAMSEMLTTTDVDTLAAHYARQTARAVVYVMLPCK